MPVKDRPWAARSVPALRRDLVSSFWAIVDRARRAERAVSGLPEPVRSIMAERNRADGSDPEQMLRWVRQLERADLFWVTGAMARQAMDAALDVPTFDMGSLLTSNGLMLFADPLPPVGGPPVHLIGGGETKDRFPVWGMWWHLDSEGRAVVELITRAGDLSGFASGFGELQNVRTIIMNGGQRQDLTDMTAGTDPALLGVWAFLQAACTLMDTPTVAERRELDARTGAWVRPARTRPGDVVSIVDLRTMRYVRTDDAERDASGRKLTVRFVVRGHWTHQAYGPGRSERRLQYVAPYLKGPEGAPLVGGEKVMVWRR